MTKEEYKNLSKDERKKVKFKDAPTSNKIGFILFLVLVTLLLGTCIGTCGNNNSNSESKGIDTVRLELTARYKMEDAVKSLLRAPSTAKFPDDAQHYWLLQDSTIVVKGSVDAQNSFGAMLRNDYYVKLKWKDDYSKDENWTIIDVKLE